MLVVNTSIPFEERRDVRGQILAYLFARLGIRIHDLAA